MGIYDEYAAACDAHEARYGPDTTVLMQVGDFFELYQYEDDDGRRRGADLARATAVMGIIITYKNKALPASRANPRFAGLPLQSLPKNARALLDAGWTVVVMRQYALPGGGGFERRVSEVLSPGVDLDAGSGAAWLAVLT